MPEVHNIPGSDGIRARVDPKKKSFQNDPYEPPGQPTHPLAQRTVLTSLPNGFAQRQNRAVTRDPSRNAMVANQLTDLLAGEGTYLTNARNRGETMARRRGFSNLTAAANAGEQAAIDSGMPIASQDAATHGSAEAQNQDALNAFESLQLQKEADAASAMAAAVAGSGGVYEAVRQQARDREREHQMALEILNDEQDWGTGERTGTQTWQQRQDEMDRRWRTGEREGTQGWTSREAGRDRRFQGGQAEADRRFRANESALDRNFDRESEMGSRAWTAWQNVQQTVLTNPDIWRDAQGSAGFLQFFGTDAFNSWMNQFFPPRGNKRGR